MASGCLVLLQDQGLNPVFHLLTKPRLLRDRLICIVVPRIIAAQTFLKGPRVDIDQTALLAPHQVEAALEAKPSLFGLKYNL